MGIAMGLLPFNLVWRLVPALRRLVTLHTSDRINTLFRAECCLQHSAALFVMAQKACGWSVLPSPLHDAIPRSAVFCKCCSSRVSTIATLLLIGIACMERCCHAFLETH